MSVFDRALQQALRRIFTGALNDAVKATLAETRESARLLDEVLQDLEQRLQDRAKALDTAENCKRFLSRQGSLLADFVTAFARVPIRGREAPRRLAVVRTAALLGCLLITLGTPLLHSWITGLRTVPFASDPASPGASTALAVLLTAAALAFLAAWLLFRHDPSTLGPSGLSPVQWASQVTVLLLGLVTTGWLTMLTATVAGLWAVPVPALVGGVWTIFLTNRLIRTWWLALAHPRAAARDRERLNQHSHELQKNVAEDIQLELRPLVTATEDWQFSTRLSVPHTSILKRAHRDGHVITPAERRLIAVSNGMDDGSIALAGPRGVGKTELLTTFCMDPARFSVVLHAPVAYRQEEFLRHLFAEVCRRVLRTGPRHLRRRAGRHLRRILYVQTRSTEGQLNIPFLGLLLRYFNDSTSQPPSHPDLVDELKAFLARLGRDLPVGRRLVIGIDELDRIQPAADAQAFLNEIKAIFDVPGCLFLLSVSDEALRAAELAPVGRRDVFDSAIDEVIRVEPLRQEEAARLLSSRVIGLPAAFTGLFNVLAGGIPRDLLRITRAAILFANSVERGEEYFTDEELPETARRLVKRELDRIAGNADGQIPPEVLGLIQDEIPAEYGKLRELGERVGDANPTIANRLFFLDTVLGVFSAGLTPERIRQDAAPGGAFTILARIGSRIGTADHQAKIALRRFRERRGMDPIPPIS